jgi:molybdopterin converting factor small subunit
MAVVVIPAALQPLTGGVPRVDATGATVRDVVAALAKQFPALDGRIVDGNGIRPELFIAVGNEEIFNLDQSVPEGAEVHILPAIAGGA